MLTYICTECGTTITVEDDSKIGQCHACHSIFVLPNQFKQKENMYRLATEARHTGNFDLALTYYSRILKIDGAETEANWGYLLSKYGVEVSQKGDTYHHIFFHRVEHSSFLDDPAYKKMITYCPAEYLYYYEGLSRKIDKMHRRMLAISRKMEPVDVYINCVESDGSRDYLLAVQIGQALEKAGYRVFLSEVTLKQADKEEYNLYEMSVSEKAAAMLVLFTKQTDLENSRFASVWKRYLSLRRADAEKKILSVYQDISPEQLPMELQPFQALDGSDRDLGSKIVNEINKAFGRQSKDISVTKEILEGLRKGEELLKSRDYGRARKKFIHVTKMSARESRAYWGIVCADTANLTRPSINKELDHNYKQAVALANPAVKEKYVKQMSDLMTETVWEKLKNDTGNLTNWKLDGTEEVKEDIDRVYLYMPKIDSRLELIENYHTLANMERKAAKVHQAYMDKDTAAQPLFAELRKMQNEHQEIKSYSDGYEKSAQGYMVISIISMVCFLLAQILMVKNFCYSTSYEGILFQIARILFGLGIVGFFFSFVQMLRNTTLFGELAESYGLAAVGVLCAVFVLLSNRYVRQFYLIGLAASLILFLLLRARGLLAEFTASESQMRLKAAKKKLAVIEKQIKSAYKKDMGAVYKEYGVLEYSIPEYEIPDFQSVSKEKTGILSSAMVCYIIKTIAILGIIIGAGTIFSNQLYTSGWNRIVTVAAGKNHVAALKENGKVVANGLSNEGQCDVKSWKKVKQIVVGSAFTAGLKEDGTVYVAASKDSEVLKARKWSGIKKLAASMDHLVGLKEDGTVVAAGSNVNKECQVEDFKNIIQIVAVTEGDGSLTLALSESGKVYITPHESWEKIRKSVNHTTGSGSGKRKITHIYGKIGGVVLVDEDGKCLGIGMDMYQQLTKAEDWNADEMTDIISCNFSLGLKNDGTLVSGGTYGTIASDIEKLEDVTEVDGYAKHALILHDNGRVTAVGDNDYNQCNTSSWRRIEHVYAGNFSSFGLKKNGKLEACGRSICGMTYVSPKNPIEMIQFWMDAFSW